MTFSKRVLSGLAAIAIAGHLQLQPADAAPILCVEGPSKIRNSATHALYHQNYASAFRLFRAQALRGNAFAQMKLGVMYRMGYGVPQDFTLAIKWWRAAAEQGNANAQCNLGFMYLYGVVVRPDPVAAYMWFNLAAAGGHWDARAKRDLVAGWRLTAGQLQEAQRRSSAWLARHQ